jgi:hypothetical protein
LLYSYGYDKTDDGGVMPKDKDTPAQAVTDPSAKGVDYVLDRPRVVDEDADKNGAERPDDDD